MAPRSCSQSRRDPHATLCIVYQAYRVRSLELWLQIRTELETCTARGTDTRPGGAAAGHTNEAEGTVRAPTTSGGSLARRRPARWGPRKGPPARYRVGGLAVRASARRGPCAAPVSRRPNLTAGHVRSQRARIRPGQAAHQSAKGWTIDPMKGRHPLAAAGAAATHVGRQRTGVRGGQAAHRTAKGPSVNPMGCRHTTGSGQNLTGKCKAENERD